MDPAIISILSLSSINKDRLNRSSLKKIYTLSDIIIQLYIRNHSGTHDQLYEK